jgi:hypothetical protein
MFIKLFFVKKPSQSKTQAIGWGFKILFILFSNTSLQVIKAINLDLKLTQTHVMLCLIFIE